MPVQHGLAASALTDLLFEEPGVGRCLVAPDGSVLRANAEWLRSTGFKLDDVLGADIIDLFPETRDMALALHARVRKGHRVKVPRHAQIVNGRETWWEGSIEPVPMEGGTGLLITARELMADGGSIEARPEDWLVGGGEMGKVIRSMDWSKTPLGPIESWPQSLRTTVSLCLASNFPISLAWGPKHVQIYNDGYWPICGGKHPRSMGQD